MREIKFNYVYGIDGEVEKYFTRSFTFAEIEGGDHFDQICDGPLMKDYRILAKRQWTGLKDRNGVEIYENDVVQVLAEFGTRGKHPRGIGEHIKICAEIVFENGCFIHKEPKQEHQRRISLGNATDWYRGYCELHDCEVIGNIHQHPHLLGGSNE